MQRSDWLAIAWALACVALVSACALLLARGAPLQTNLLALLPATERIPAAERAVSQLDAIAGNRAIFLICHPDSTQAKRSGRRFAASLRESRAFERVLAEVPPTDIREVARFYLDYRFGLLTETDRRSLANSRFDPAQSLARRLNNPLQFGSAGDLTVDPFGFLDNYMADLPYRDLNFELEEGLLLARDGKAGAIYTGVLVTAELRGSAYDDRVQRAVLAAVAAAEHDLRRDASDVEVLRTGSVFYAGAARSAAEREMDLIALGSLTGIALLLLAVFRSLRPLLLGLFTVGVGLAAGITATLLVHRELHLLTLVFGASLIGEAIDYSIQYFSVYAAAGRAWEPARGFLAVRPGLMLALATSLLGYTALLLLPFPAVSQLALFALVGLAAACLTVTLLLPALLRRPYAHDISAMTAVAARFIGWWRDHVNRRTGIALAAVVVLSCAPGWLLLQIDDDVRSLTDRPASLLQQEARIRKLTGFGSVHQFFLVEGNGPEAVLRREEALGARLRALAASGEISHYHAVSSFVPSAAWQSENRALVRRALLNDQARLERAFDQLGFPDGMANGLERAFRQSEGHVLTPETWLATPAAAPFRHLWLGAMASGYASIVLPYGILHTGPLAGAAVGIDGVTLVDKAGSVSRVFRQYRIGLSGGLTVAGMVVLALLSRRYGWAGAAAVLLPTLLGIAFALALAGYTGAPATLFSIMALMLVLGVGINYPIFLVEGRGREATTLIAVVLSAVTTLLSFGLLAFSGTPALAQFGATLFAGIGAAVVLAPLALTLAPRRE